MNAITVEHQVSPAKLDTLAVDRWPIWEKEVSTFDWHYDQTEMCYILDGEVLVTPVGGEPVLITVGDLVTFPAGMDCSWEIREAIRKHYVFK